MEICFGTVICWKVNNFSFKIDLFYNDINDYVAVQTINLVSPSQGRFTSKYFSASWEFATLSLTS